MKPKRGLLLLVMFMLAGSILAATPVDAAPKKAAQHCALILGEHQITCYASQDEIVVGQNHILFGIFYEFEFYNGNSLSIFNNDGIPGCSNTGVPNLAAVGWDNKISSFDNRCGSIRFFVDNNYQNFFQTYGIGRFSFNGQAINNQISSFKWL